MDKVKLRTIEPNDFNLITSSFLRGTYYGNNLYRKIEPDVYFTKYKQVLAHILAKPHTNIVIACLADEPDIILGWAAYENNILHFVYVKDAFRQQGIAKLLTSKAKIDTVTHITQLGDKLRTKYGWKYNPFAV